MSDWSAGYVADVSYTYGYYPELSPLRAKMAFLNQGIACPEFGTACELGFGQGLSANMHAAATVTKWYGTDFNPSQAAFAQEIAKISDAGAQLYDDAFADFLTRQDLPQFDYIGLHGIWSWISDENRRTIVEFVRCKLKLGGVLYISYNTLPGWSAFAPVRHILNLHAKIEGSEGQGTLGRIDKAFQFAEEMLEANPGYLRANPGILDRFKKIKGQNRSYVAHEYFNRDWEPMHFSALADWLEPAKVQYACSASYLESVEALNITSEQKEFLATIEDTVLKESVKDYMVNQQFRRDYWVKGLRKISALEQAEALRNQRLVLVAHRKDVTLTVTGALGEANMSEAVYGPILDFLADHKCRTLGQIEQAIKDKGVSFSHLRQAVMVLIGAGHVALAQEEGVALKAKKQTDRLNSYILQQARAGGDIACLASPLLAGGIAVGRFLQIFLLAIIKGKKKPADWAEFAWETLDNQGQKLVIEGKALESVEDNVRELTSQAMKFEETRLPMLRALMVI